MEKKVRVRIFDRNDRHLEDVQLKPSEVVYIAPGKYLSDYRWSGATTITKPKVRQVISVGTAHEGLRDVACDEDHPWLSVWVDAV